MAHRLLWDGLTRHAFRLDTGLPVVVAYHPHTPRYVIRVVIDAGLREDTRDAPGAVALLATVLGTSHADRLAGRMTGADALLDYHTVEVCLSGPELGALAAELALRLAGPPPTDGEVAVAWDAFRPTAVDAMIDREAVIANHAHKMSLAKDSPHSYVWPCGNRYFTRPDRVPCPSAETVRRRWCLIAQRRVRVYVVSPVPGLAVEALLRASPLAWWVPRRPDHAPLSRPRKASLRGHGARHPVYTFHLPSAPPPGTPEVTTLWTIATLGGSDPRTAYLDLLARVGDWPFTVSSWVHPEGSVLCAWAQGSVLDTSGPARLVKDVQRALRPVIEGQRLDRLWQGARRAYDADQRALLRDPEALSHALAADDGPGALPSLPRVPDYPAATAALSVLARGVSAPRVALILPPGAVFPRHGIGRVALRPLDQW